MLVGVCEDDAAIRRLLTRALTGAGHEVVVAHDGGEALRLFGTDSAVEVVVMDIGLPDSDGRDVVLALRSAGQHVPVLFLTALGAVHDRISGFHAGGDDYVAKPFDVTELLVRLEALDRRGRPVEATVTGLTLDPAAHTVRTESGSALLTPTEYRMLAAIAARPGEVVRRRAVVAAAWPDGAHVSENTVDSFIRRIRRKLDSVDSAVGVDTVRGVGFPTPVSGVVSLGGELPVAPGSFRRQIVTLTVCVTAFAMIVLSVALQIILSLQTSRDIDRVLEDRAEAVAGVITSRGGSLIVPPSALDEGVVVYDATGTPVAGLVPAELAEEYAALSRAVTPTYRSVDDVARLRGVPLETASGAGAVVVVTERLTPYENAERYALFVSLATGLLATVAAGLIAAWGTRRALRPVAAMTAAAAEWSERDLTRRFDLGGETNELTMLAGVLDRLLDRVASAIGSEQQLTSELAHELRTPLTAVRAGVDLALRRPDLDPELRRDLEDMAEAAGRMSDTISTLLELARGTGAVQQGRSASVRAVLDDLLASHPWAPVEVAVEDAGLRLGIGEEVAARALAPVLANALRFARSRVAVSAEVVAGMVEIRIEDDGPGVRTDDDVFAPGITDGSGSGAGLGLALARRVALGVGGGVECESRVAPTAFVVRLPRG